MNMNTRIINKAFFGSVNVSKLYQGSELVWPLNDYGFILEPVDLGLSVKWASCNLGAMSPTDYGNYYAWAEKVTKQEYTYENYTWFDVSTQGGQTSVSCTYYNEGSNYMKLSDDIAYAASNNWKIPTSTDYVNLWWGTTHEWVTLNGVEGYKFTGRREYSTNWIFLPAAGEFVGNKVKFSERQPGENNERFGFYWTSSSNYRGSNASSQSASAWYAGYDYDVFNRVLEFETCASNVPDSTLNKSVGLPIRPVCTT